jgi:hypothetical protein
MMARVPSDFSSSLRFQTIYGLSRRRAVRLLKLAGKCQEEMTKKCILRALLSPRAGILYANLL